MQITVAKTAGFCFGVQRAVDEIFSLLERESRPVVTLGPLIHNPQITQRLEQKGVRIVAEVPQAPFGGVVVLRSHGVPKQCYEQLEQRGIDFVDLTCPFVERIHSVVPVSYTHLLSRSSLCRMSAKTCSKGSSSPFCASSF